jgi:hypothetical protein
MGLPLQVELVRLQLNKFPKPELVDIASKLLIPSDQELCSTWVTIKNYSHTVDELWVWAYLNKVRDCLNVPRYHNLNKKDRKELIKDIQSISKELVMKLSVNGLDATLIHSNGVNFNGFFLYEDFGESNQSQIDQLNTNKLLVSSLITKIVSRAVEKIDQEPMPGKKGKNSEAVRFIRMMVAHHMWSYRTPLNKVVVNFANALFGTSYSESDISNLIKRQPLQS